MSELLGTSSLVDWAGLGVLVSRLALDLGFATIVIRLVYYRLYANREYVFTYFLFNVITFAMCLLLRKVPTHFGLALALFGVFGILFVVIGIGVLNAIADKSVSVAELLVVDATIVALTAFLELGASSRGERSTLMVYDQLELLRPGNEAKLVADISAKTGLSVLRVEVNRFDLLRDAAEITLFYRPR